MEPAVRGSSMAEHSTVNRRVVGSSPTPGAGSSARPERALAVPATTRGTNSVPTQGPKRAAPSHRPRTVSLHAEWRRRPQDIPSLDMLTGMYANGEEVEPLVGMSSDRVLSSGDKALSLIDGRGTARCGSRRRRPPPGGVHAAQGRCHVRLLARLEGFLVALDRTPGYRAAQKRCCFRRIRYGASRTPSHLSLSVAGAQQPRDLLLVALTEAQATNGFGEA
jgi:hypothetical protein